MVSVATWAPGLSPAGGILPLLSWREGQPIHVILHERWITLMHFLQILLFKETHASVSTSISLPWILQPQIIKLYRTVTCCYFLSLTQFALNWQRFPLSFAQSTLSTRSWGKHNQLYLCERFFMLWVNESSQEEIWCLQPWQWQCHCCQQCGDCHLSPLNDLYSDQPLHCTLHIFGLYFWTWCGFVRCCFSRDP